MPTADCKRHFISINQSINQYLYSQQSAEKKEEKEIHYNIKLQKHNECSKYNQTAFLTE